MTRALLLAFAAVVLMATMACGGGDSATPTPSPTPDLGAGGSLPRHLTAVLPANGSDASNAEFRANVPQGGSEGICGTFSFAGGDGMGDDPTKLVKLFVQDEDVTSSATWQVTASQPPTGGTICYVPQTDLPVGQVLATLRWSEVPVGTAEARQFIYSWQFNITG